MAVIGKMLNRKIVVHFILIIITFRLADFNLLDNKNLFNISPLEKHNSLQTFIEIKLSASSADFLPRPNLISTKYSNVSSKEMSKANNLWINFFILFLITTYKKYQKFFPIMYCTIIFFYTVNGNLIGQYSYSTHVSTLVSSFVTTSIGDILIAGSSYPGILGSQDIFQMRINSSFSLLSIQYFGDAYRDGGYSNCITPTEESVIVGFTENTVTLCHSFFLLLIDSSDYLIWVKKYYGTSCGYFTGVKCLGNGNILVVGYRDIGYFNGRILLFNLNGDILLEYTSTNQGVFYALDLQSDNSIIISGYSQSVQWELITKFDSLFSSLWEKTLHKGILYSIVSGSSGNIFACGYIVDSTQHFYVALTNSEGVYQWTQEQSSGFSGDKCKSVTHLADGNYAAAGILGSAGFGGNEALILKFSESGTLLFYSTYGGTRYDSLSMIKQEIDGGFIAIGESDSFDTPPTYYQVYVKVGYFSCEPGYYGLSSICQLCPVGKFSSESGATECSNCYVGYYQNLIGQSSCKACAAGYNHNVLRTSCLYKGIFLSISDYISSSFKSNCFNSNGQIKIPYTEACRTSYRSLCCTGSSILSTSGPICNFGLEISNTSSLYNKYCSACTFLDQTKCPKQGVCWDDSLYTSNAYNPYTSFSSACILAIKPYCGDKLQINPDDGECYVFKTECAQANIASVKYGSSFSSFTIVANQKYGPEVIPNDIFSNDMSNSTVLRTSGTELLVNISKMSSPPTSIQFKYRALKNLCDVGYSDLIVYTITKPTVTFETISITPSSSPIDRCTNLIILCSFTKPYSWDVTYTWNVLYTTIATPSAVLQLASQASATNFSLTPEYLLLNQNLQISYSILNPFSQTVTSNVLVLTVRNPVNYPYPCSPCQFHNRTKCFDYESVCWNNFNIYNTSYPLLYTESCLLNMAVECYAIWSQNGTSDSQCLGYVSVIDFSKMLIKPKVISCNYFVEGILKIRITFDVDIKTTLLPTCNVIFAEDTIKSIGSNAQCLWNSTRDLDVVFSGKGTLITSLTLKEKSIYFNYKYAINPADSLTLHPELPDLSGTAIIEGASNVPYGKSLVLTAVTQVNGVFEYAYTWNLAYLQGSVSSTILSKFVSIASINSKILTVDSENLLADRNLQINLTVHIYSRNIEFNTTKSVYISSQMPEVSFASTELYALDLIGSKTNNLGLNVNNDPGNNGRTDQPEITFTVYSGNQLKDISTKDPKLEATLSLNYQLYKILTANIKSGFQYNHFYNITVCANFIGFTLQSCKTKILAINKPEISAVIFGVETLVPVSEPLVLNGARSIIPFDTDEKVTFKWQCISCYSYVTNSNCSCPYMSDSEAASRVYTITANQLSASCKFSYRLTVTSQNGVFLRTDSVEAMFISGAFSNVKGILINGNLNDLYMTFSLGYKGKDSDLSFELSPIEASSNLFNNSFSYSKLNTVIYDFFARKNVTLNPLCKSEDQEIPNLIKPKEITANNKRIVGIDKSSLVSEGQYKYSVLISEPNDLSLAIVSIQAPKFPTSRSFQVTPTSGYALQTFFIFTFSVNSGISNPDEVVKIFILKCDGTEKLVYSTIGSSTMFEGVLSAGGSECYHKVTVILRVFLKEEYIDTNLQITVLPSAVPPISAISSLLASAETSNSYLNTLSILSSVTQTAILEASEQAKLNVDKVYRIILQMDDEKTGVRSRLDSTSELQFHNMILGVFENLFEQNIVSNLNSTLQELIEEKIYSYILSCKEDSDSVYLVPSVTKALSASISLKKKREGQQSYATIRKTLEHIRKIIMPILQPGGPSYEMNTLNIAFKVIKQYGTEFNLSHEITNTVLINSTQSGSYQKAETKVKLPAGLTEKVFKNIPHVSTYNTTFVVCTTMTSLKFNPYENIKTNSLIDINYISTLSYNSKMISPQIIHLIYHDMRYHSLDNVVDLYKQDTDLIQLTFNGSSIEKDATTTEHEEAVIVGKLENNSLVQFRHPYYNSESSFDNYTLIPEYKESNYWTNKNCSLFGIEGIDLITECKCLGSDKGSTSGNVVDIAVDVISDLYNVLISGNYKSLYSYDNYLRLTTKKIILLCVCGAVFVGLIASSSSLFLFDKKAIFKQKIKTLKMLAEGRSLPPAQGMIVELIRFINNIKRKGIQPSQEEKKTEVYPDNIPSTSRTIGNIDTSNGYSSLNEEEKQQLQDLLALYKEKRRLFSKEEVVVILESEIKNCAPLNRRAPEYTEDTMLGYTGILLFFFQHKFLSPFFMVDLRITRPIKLLVLAIVLFGELAVGGLFCNSEKSIHLSENTSSIVSKSTLYGFVSVVILLPINIIVSAMLSGLYLKESMTREEIVSQEQCAKILEKVGFVLGWSILILEMYAIVMFCVNFSDSSFNMWMITYSFSFIVDYLLSYVLRFVALVLYAKLVSKVVQMKCLIGCGGAILLKFLQFIAWLIS